MNKLEFALNQAKTMDFGTISPHGSNPSFSPEPSHISPPHRETRRSSSESLLTHTIMLALQTGGGYLCAKLFTQVDPLTGALCGAVNSIALQLLIVGGARPTQARKIGTVAIAILAPFATCRLLDLSISFKASCGICFGSLLTTASVLFLANKLERG